MLKKLLIPLSLLSSAAFADSNGFLSEAEETAISHHLTSQSIPVIDLDGFSQYSETPALVVGETDVEGYKVLIVERDGSRALLAGMDLINALEGWTVFDGVIKEDSKGDKGPKQVYCSSSCLDDALGGFFSGGLDGAVKGGTAGAAIGGGIGWWVGGPPGVVAGGSMVGTGGAILGGAAGGTAGAIKEFNTCQKDLAVVCGDSKK